MRVMGLSAAAACPALLVCADAALAHVAGSAISLDEWNLDPLVVALSALAAALYGFGIARLWRRAGRTRGIHAGQALSFAAGWLVLCISLLSPLDRLGSRQLWLHMVQHELLMLVAAPLLVLGRPLQAWTWALAPPGRRLAGQAARWRGLRFAWRRLTSPVAAWLLHAAAVWIWHAPSLFQQALASESLHTIQHTSFIVTALLFWWTVLGRLGHPLGHGTAAAALFTTMLHTGALGALLSFSGSVWYPIYIERGALSWEAALTDQHLAGLIMWIPGGFVYLAAALGIASHWFARVTKASALP